MRAPSFWKLSYDFPRFRMQVQNQKGLLRDPICGCRQGLFRTQALLWFGAALLQSDSRHSRWETRLLRQEFLNICSCSAKYPVPWRRIRYGLSQGRGWFHQLRGLGMSLGIIIGLHVGSGKSHLADNSFVIFCLPFFVVILLQRTLPMDIQALVSSTHVM